MRSIAFIITIIGIFILVISLNQKPITIDSQDDLTKLQQNQKVAIQGEVIEERTNKNSKLIVLDNELQLNCPIPCPSYLNKNITAVGIIETWTEIPRIKLLKIQEKS